MVNELSQRDEVTLKSWTKGETQKERVTRRKNYSQEL